MYVLQDWHPAVGTVCYLCGRSLRVSQAVCGAPTIHWECSHPGEVNADDTSEITGTDLRTRD